MIKFILPNVKSKEDSKLFFTIELIVFQPIITFGKNNADLYLFAIIMQNVMTAAREIL